MSSASKSIILLIPYFGEWPEWINLYLETCKWNPTIDWLFFTDCGEPENRCDNVRYVHISLDDFEAFASCRLGVNLRLRDPYKICDLRPAFGLIFKDHIRGYDYFGFGDIDVVYGAVRKFVTDAVLQRDIISFHRERLSGHFCLFRNRPAMRQLHRRIENWRSKLTAQEWLGLDDTPTELAGEESRHYVESFNTPLTRVRPWRDGTYSWPTEWYWSRGTLTNDKDEGVEFPYLHFMVWKGGRWGKLHGGGQWEELERVVHFDWRKAPNGWKINEAGFHRI